MANLNILPPGTTLVPGQGLVSPNGRYHLDFQTDGNLVAYDLGQGVPPPGQYYWASNTSGNPFASFTLQPDGQMVIKTSGGQLAWYATPNPIPGSFLVLQDDGNAVLYDTNGNAGWNTQAIENSGTTVWQDLGGAILSIPQGAVDDFVNIIQMVPGVPWLGEQLKDFANTAVGAMILRAVAAGLEAAAVTLGASGGIAAAMGPPLAATAIAIPSLAKGDRFAASFISELAWQIATTAEYFVGMFVQGVAQDINSATAALSADLQNATQQILANLPTIPGLSLVNPLSLSALTAEGLSTLANRLHVREDSLQMAIDAFSGTHSMAMPPQPAHLLPGNVPVAPQPARSGKKFDPITGRELVPSGAIIFGGGGNLTPPVAPPTTSTATKTAYIAGGTVAAIAGGSWIYTYFTKQAYGKFWNKIWNDTGGKLTRKL